MGTQEKGPLATDRPRPSSQRRVAGCLAFVALTYVAASHFGPDAHLFPVNLFPWHDPFRSSTCPAPKPNIFAYHPPRPSNELIAKASESLDKWLVKRVSKDDLDSLSIAIVTPAGPIFEKGYGVLRANESDTENQPPVDRDTIYRLASVSKVFTVLETLILRERGVLNWDDPVEKYLPDFSPPSYGWSNYLNGFTDTKDSQSERITLRQVASHLAGIGRDLPPTDIPDWPNTDGVKSKGYEQRKYADIMKAISQYPLINVPWQYPIYSNIGLDMVGHSNVAANKLASSDPDSEPQTHKELIKRDILDPLGLNSSFFRVPDSPLREHIAVPKNYSEWADIPLGDADDPAGGQYASAKDLGKLIQTLLSPTARGGLIPARAVREWLRPLSVWGGTGQQVGVPWEILQFDNAQVFSKGGSIQGYFSEFALVPEYAYGVVLLTSGLSVNTIAILKEIIKHFQAGITRLYHVELERRYVGTWTNGDDVAEITLDKGKSTLFIKKLVVGGKDVLKVVQDMGYELVGGASPVALWSTGREGEFRLAFGRPKLNSDRDIGCLPYWLSVDPGMNSRGAPIDLLYWNRGYLTYPSGGVSFARK